MQTKTNGINKGFTLIELLVVIAIISLLSSIVLASLNSARAKARDAKKISEFKQFGIALALYFDKYGRYPLQGANPATNEHTDGFNAMATELKAEGFLGTVPVNPSGGGGVGGYSGYNYYNYGPGAVGGLLVTVLETIPSTTTGISPSCRPNWGGPNWCDPLVSSKYYCICNPY